MAATSTNAGGVKTATAATTGAWQQVVAWLESIALVVWLGGMIFFSFAVAPGAFSVLPTRELAGRVVNNLIGKLELVGLVCGPLLLLLQATAWPKRESEAKSRILRAILLAVMTILIAGSRFWVSPKISALRAEIGVPIDEIPLTDALRVQFNALHGVSVSLMAATMIGGFAVLLLTVRIWLKR